MGPGARGHPPVAWDGRPCLMMLFLWFSHSYYVSYISLITRAMRLSRHQACIWIIHSYLRRLEDDCFQASTVGTVGQDQQLQKRKWSFKNVNPSCRGCKDECSAHSLLKVEPLVFLSHFVMFYEGKLAAEAPGAGPGHGARGARRDQTRGRGSRAGGFCPNLTPLLGSGPAGFIIRINQVWTFPLGKSLWCHSCAAVCLWFNISNDIQSGAGHLVRAGSLLVSWLRSRNVPPASHIFIIRFNDSTRGLGRRELLIFMR